MEMELFFIGLVLTLAFVAATGFYPGGIIVPGYLVLFVDQPLRLAGTLTAALITLGILRLANRWLILFGQRRFVFLILCGASLSMLFPLVFPTLSPQLIEFRVIGWVIPGLIANHLDRQGIPVTLASMAIAVTVLYFLGTLWTLLF
jgi:poly-gamma-glutamate biosynthesis protein PgsC/CapC